MRFYWLRPSTPQPHTGRIDATHRWGLPGVHCPTCSATWGDTALAYPSVDLTPLPNRAEYEEPRAEPLEEFERLRELVHSRVPPGAPLRPGTRLVRREALERLEGEGVRALKGCRTELRFRQKNPPELLELELWPRGRLHEQCLPARPPPCGRCGRDGFRRPEHPILEAKSLPEDVALFRLENFESMLVCSGRFQEAVTRLQLAAGLEFNELPLL